MANMATTSKAANTSKATKAGKRTPMSDDHKAALAQGREEGRTVRHYLEALDSNRPRRGRKRSPDSIQRRLAAVEERLGRVDPMARLHLLQEQADLRAALQRSAQAGDGDDLTSLEAAFVKVAKAYGDRKSINYSTWRSAGVSAETLRKAGISRARG